MLKHYISTAWRNLIKYKGLAATNIAGLVVGIAASFILLGYITFQSGYDNFNANKKDIYRVDLSLYEGDKLTFQSAENYPALAPALKKDLPEVLDAARLYNMGYKNNCVFSCNNKSFRETRFFYADNTFLHIFTYPFLEGDAHNALSQPFSAVISSSLAKKIFGSMDPVGQSIRMDDDDRNAELCRITGVFKDPPANSHLQFDILISYNTLYQRREGMPRFETSWDRKDFYTYILLRQGTDPAKVQERMAAFVEKNIPAEKAIHRKSLLSLRPLQDIHLSTGLADEPSPTVNPSAITYLLIIAFFILTIGWINYINMNTASAANRAREIGVRKVLGSSRTDLIRQFLLESFSLITISTVIAVCMALAVRPLLEDQFQIHLQFRTILQQFPGCIWLGAILLGSFLSGLYPAFVLSSLRPVSVLKGKADSRPGGLVLRKSLLVFQFALSIFLIIGSVVVYQQVHFMLNKDLGMNMNKVLVLDRPGKWDTARTQHNLYVQRFKETLMQSPDIEAVGMSDELPGKEIRNPGLYSLDNAAAQSPQAIAAISVDENFLSLLQFKLIAGRGFSPQYKTDKNGLVMTASAARSLGLHSPEQAIGRKVMSDGASYTILGVVVDFHQMSLDKQEKPIIFQLNNSDAREFEYYLVKIRVSGNDRAIRQIQDCWNGSFRNNPFNYRFLDEDFNRQYSSVLNFRTLFTLFTIIAILISCIGLFSLLAFMIRQRIREIGIRKILGAGVRDILLLLAKDFLRLVLLANLLAWPLGWLLMNSWLSDFAYRIRIDLQVFYWSGTGAILIAMLTISIQSVRAALTNPVRSIKTE